jgi:hypothetical protein
MRHVSARALQALLLVAFALLPAAGCKPQSTNPAGITVDPTTMVLHNVNIFASQNANDYNNSIMVIDITYTNHDPIPQALEANKFVLIDQNTLAQYHALDGGDIHVPVFTQSGLLDPDKTVDLSLGFRVPASIVVARLSYSP